MAEYKMIGKNRFFLEARYLGQGDSSKRDAEDSAARHKKAGYLVRVKRGRIDRYRSTQRQRTMRYWELWVCPPNWQYKKGR